MQGIRISTSIYCMNKIIFLGSRSHIVKCHVNISFSWFAIYIKEIDLASSIIQYLRNNYFQYVFKVILIRCIVVIPYTIERFFKVLIQTYTYYKWFQNDAFLLKLQ